MNNQITKKVLAILILVGGYAMTEAKTRLVEVDENNRVVAEVRPARYYNEDRVYYNHGPVGAAAEVAGDAVVGTAEVAGDVVGGVGHALFGGW